MSQSGLEQNLRKLLRELDESSAPTSESDVHSKIRALHGADPENELPLEYKAEGMAFAFCENYPDKDTGWGTYFGPFAVFPNDDGSVTEAPSISLVDDEMITYWVHRGNECSNPLLKARYLGLAWDFSKKVTGTAASHEIGRAYVANLLRVAEDNLHKHEVDTIGKLDRALSVALSLNATDLVSECKDTILAYERRIAVDDKPGLCGFSFDLLLVNKNVTLCAAEEEAIIADLEARLERLSSGSGDVMSNPWMSEDAAQRLATHYHARKRPEEVARVLGKLQGACEDVAGKAAPLLGYALLQRLHSTYMRFHLSKQADAITVRIRELGAGINGDMKEISHTVEIPRKEFDAYTEAITEGGLDKAIPRIAVKYAPRQDETRNALLKLSKRAPLQFLIRKHITDHTGRVVAVVGPLEEDMQGHIAHWISQNMSFSVPFLDGVLVRLVDRYNLTAHTLADYIRRAPVFHEEKQSILNLGLEFYLNGNCVVAAHLLIPQIEDAIRELVEMSGGAVRKLGRGGGFLIRTLDELLRDDTVEQALGQDMAAYLRVLFTDQRGWNLRNNVCHGLFPSEAFGKPMADRILHSLFCIGLLRREQEGA